MDRVYLWLFYIFRFFTRITPRFITNAFISTIAFLVSLLNNKHRRVAELNLDIAFGNKKSPSEKKLLIRRAYKGLLFTLIDFVKNQGIEKEELDKKIEFKDAHFLQDALKENRKVIIMTAHYGNWELLSLSIASKFTPLSIVGRDLDSKVMNEILVKNREQFDVELLSKTGAMKGMVKALKQNRPIGILVDQNTNDNEGVIVNFFGEKVRHTPSVAVLARKFDALIIPAFIHTYDYNDYIVTFYEPIEFEESENKEDDIVRCVQKQSDITQHIIEKKPDEWFWFHKRWKYTREKDYK